MVKKAIFVLSILVLILFSGCQGTYFNCEGNKNEDEYYRIHFNDPSNDSRDFNKYNYKCVTGSRKADKLAQEKRNEKRKALNEKALQAEDCYESGYDVNLTFDIIVDYNFSCNKIEYINDHLLLTSEKRNGGYIKGSSSGLLSSGYIEGKFYQYVNKEILATGLLVRTFKAHYDCNNNTNFWKSQFICDDGSIGGGSCWGRNKVRDTIDVEFYSEADFVMYYIDNCVKEE